MNYFIANIKEFTRKLNIPDDALKLNTIYEYGASPSSFYGVSTQFMPVLERFSAKNINTSNLFKVCWNENLQSMYSDIDILYEQSESHPKHPTTFKQAIESVEEGLVNFEMDEFPLNFNLSQVLTYLILPSLNNAYQVMMRLSTGNISISESIMYTEFCKAEELHQLNSFFEANVSEEAIKKSFLKLECALNMNKCGQQSDAILQTAEVLNLRGDFLSIEMIKEKVK